MAEDPNVKTKQNSTNIAGVQQSVARIENEMLLDDGFNAAAKPTNNSMGAVFSAPITGASWQVRTNYSVNSISGIATGRFEIYGPRVYSNGKRVEIANCGSDGWLSLDNIVKANPASSGTLTARFVLNVKKTENEDGTESATKKISSCNIFFRADGASTPAATATQETVDMDICRINTSAIKPISQIHTGVLTFTGETVAAGGTGISVTEDDYAVRIYYAENKEIWLSQGIERNAENGVATGRPRVKILRIDNLFRDTGIMVTSGSGCTAIHSLGTSPYYFEDAPMSLPKLETEVVGVPPGFSGSADTPEFKALAQEYVTDWLSALCVHTPIDETEQGFLQGLCASNKFFALQDATTGTSEIYFYTEVANSNDITEYMTNYTDYGES